MDDAKDVEARSPMLGYLNQRVVLAQDGASHVEATPTAAFYNPMGRVHGGFVAALIDTALGVAVMTKLPKGTQYGTVDLNVKFVRKIEVATGVLHARGNVLHAGRTMLTAEARIEDAAGKLYAHGSGTFLVYPKQ
jgi:acyl-CoA thioesterase